MTFPIFLKSSLPKLEQPSHSSMFSVRTASNTKMASQESTMNSDYLPVSTSILIICLFLDDQKQILTPNLAYGPEVESKIQSVGRHLLLNTHCSITTCFFT